LASFLILYTFFVSLPLQKNGSMYLIGCDIGSSSVKVSIVNAETGQVVGSDFFPKTEAPILSCRAGYAEQNPSDWWAYLKNALHGALMQSNISKDSIKAIGITYQMHGLVLVNQKLEVIRPAIIWCDSRGVAYGEKAFSALGSSYCLEHLLNSPGNFTAAKLAWVKENESENFNNIYKFMLPGDYIAMQMSGDINTTVSGLSEGIFWDFQRDEVSSELLSYFGFSKDILASIVPTFGRQCELSEAAAAELGLRKGIPITYRAGDQPNNALSLNVLNPGEVAATAGTSGVVYGINDRVNYDSLSRINIFAHVNHTSAQTRLGMMHCTNGVGILNAWMKRTIAPQLSYNEFNTLASTAPIGADGLSILPFGNGAERILQNKEIQSSIHGLNFNIHNNASLARAAQEGVAFSFKYGMDIMQEIGMDTRTIRAGNANMFLSPIFRDTLAGVTSATIELYDTNGSVGAALGAGVGAGIYNSPEEALSCLQKIEVVEPDLSCREQYLDAYNKWKTQLIKQL